MGSAAAWAVPVATSLLGAYSNRESARIANRPQSSTTSGQIHTNQTLNPYGGAASLDAIQGLGNLGLGYGLANFPYGPSAFQNQAADMVRQAAIRGVDLSQIHAPHIPQVNIGEIHGAHSPQLDASLERLRTGAGRPSANIGSLGIKLTDLSPQEIATFTPDVDPYLKPILEGRFLNENPHLDDVIESMQDDAYRSYRRSLPPQIDANFARGGRLGSNAYQTAQVEAFDEFDENVRREASRIRAESYENERNRMLQAAGINVEQVVATRQQLLAARNQELASATALRQQAIASWQQGAIAEAQIYASQAEQHAALAAQAQMMQAQLDQQVNIAMAGLGLEAQVANNQFALQGADQNMRNLLNFYNVAGAQQNEARQGALAPLGILGSYADLILPMLAQFGTTSSTQTQRGTNLIPGAGVSPTGSALMGALGGYLSGYNMMGGKQGNTNQVQSQPNYNWGPYTPGAYNFNFGFGG